MFLLGGLAGVAWLGLRTVPSPPKLREEPAIEITGPILTRFDEEGQRWWELEARSIAVDQETDRTLAEGVRLRFFRNEQAALEVTATRLLLFNQSEEMELEGGVEARGSGGLKFYTERMRWDPQRQVLVSAAEVEISRGENRLTGTGFQYWPQEGKLRIEEEARLILLPEE